MEIKQYSLFEMPSDTDVKVITPSGNKITLEMFLKQDVSFSYSDVGTETVTPVGKPYGVVRFFPDETGVYKITGGGKETSISVVEGENKGFVEISKKDKRYFCLSNGEPFYIIGINMAYINPVNEGNGKEFGQGNNQNYLGLKNYERYFREASENGVNTVRIWLGYDYFCPDTEEINKFDLVKFAKIDAVISLAEKYGLRLKFTFEQFRFFDYERIADSNSFADNVFRKFNKKLYNGGKRCNSANEWLFTDVWQDAWFNKVKQFSLRFGGNPTVAIIELWNEMNCIENSASWNKTALPKVKAMFKKQLVVNSLGSFDSDYAKNAYTVFPWEESDFKQMHRYLDAGANYEICRHSPINLISDGIEKLRDDEKPFLVAETGAVDKHHSDPFRYYTADHLGILFCDFVYTPVFCLSSGVGNIWHWDNTYVEGKNLYPYFKPIAKLCENVDFPDENFKNEKIETENYVLLILEGKNTTLCYLRNKADNWENVLRDLNYLKSIPEININKDFSGNLNVINVWHDETAETKYINGKLAVNNLKHGLLLKFVKN